MIAMSKSRILCESKASTILIRYRAQVELKTTRDQYTTEKGHLKCELDELKKSKIELQVEIGHLLREKRATELQLETAQRV